MDARRRRRVVVLAACLAYLSLAAANWWSPRASTTTRGLFVVGSLGGWLGTGVLLWRQRWGFATWVVTTAGLVALAVWPSRLGSTEALRDAYVDRLRSFGGTPYVWGGENARGLDCSGLVRRALIDAHLERAAREPSPAHLRRACDLWWHDEAASDLGAPDLGASVRESTRSVTAAESLNDVDTRLLHPGDLAVTRGGRHVLAYVGGDEWVSADPDRRIVVAETAPSTSTWFAVPVRIVRWSDLAEER